MNLLELLDELGVPHLTEGHEHCREGWAQLDCPWCTPQAQHWRLGIHLSSCASNCYACGHKSTIQAIALTCDRPYKEIESLLGVIDRPLSRREIKQRGQLVLPEGLEPLLPAHQHYLRQRGFDPDELVRLWGLQALGPRAGLPWRLWVPFIHDGRVVSWTTRKLSDKGRRYHSARAQEEELDHKRLLGGEDYCRHAVVAVEGFFDAARIGPGAVWTSGTAWTTGQLLKLAHYPVRAVCFDQGDPEAQKQARALCRQLSSYPGQTYRLELESGRDPATASFEEIQSIRQRFLHSL